MVVILSPRFDLIPGIGHSFQPEWYIVGSGGGWSIHLWDVVGRNLLGAISTPTTSTVRDIAFAPSGNTLASCGDRDDAVQLWDVQTRQRVARFSGHAQNGVWAVAMSPDGRLLASGGWFEDEAVRLWDLQTEQKIGELEEHLGITMGLAFSPDGTILASGYSNQTVCLWDVETQNQLGTLGGHSAHVGSIAFSLNGAILASTVNWDDTIHFWDIEKQQHLGVFVGHDPRDSGAISHVAFSSDGKWLACGSENGVELWEPDQPQTMLTELMLFVMSEFYPGNIDAELAWNALVNVQAAVAALDSGNSDEGMAAMGDLKALIDDEAETNSAIAPGTAGDIN
jgi:WD40 repeat protein